MKLREKNENEAFQHGIFQSCKLQNGNRNEEEKNLKHSFAEVQTTTMNWSMETLFSLADTMNELLIILLFILNKIVIKKKSSTNDSFEIVDECFLPGI